MREQKSHDDDRYKQEIDVLDRELKKIYNKQKETQGLLEAEIKKLTEEKSKLQDYNQNLLEEIRDLEKRNAGMGVVVFKYELQHR